MLPSSTFLAENIGDRRDALYWSLMRLDLE
jgi:hypothetical protein